MLNQAEMFSRHQSVSINDRGRLRKSEFWVKTSFQMSENAAPADYFGLTMLRLFAVLTSINRFIPQI